jgi:hypothetical protein
LDFPQMRGGFEDQDGLFSYISPEARLALEALVDNAGLVNVLFALARIADDRADSEELNSRR